MLYGPDGKLIASSAQILGANGQVISQSYQFRDQWNVDKVLAEFFAIGDNAARRYCRNNFRNRHGIVTQGERMVGQQIAQEGGRQNG